MGIFNIKSLKDKYMSHEPTAPAPDLPAVPDDSQAIEEALKNSVSRLAAMRDSGESSAPGISEPAAVPHKPSEQRPAAQAPIQNKPAQEEPAGHEPASQGTTRINRSAVPLPSFNVSGAQQQETNTEPGYTTNPAGVYTPDKTHAEPGQDAPPAPNQHPVPTAEEPATMSSSALAAVASGGSLKPSNTAQIRHTHQEEHSDSQDGHNQTDNLAPASYGYDVPDSGISEPPYGYSIQQPSTAKDAPVAQDFDTYGDGVSSGVDVPSDANTQQAGTQITPVTPAHGAGNSVKQDAPQTAEDAAEQPAARGVTPNHTGTPHGAKSISTQELLTTRQGTVLVPGVYGYELLEPAQEQGSAPGAEPKPADDSASNSNAHDASDTLETSERAPEETVGAEPAVAKAAEQKPTAEDSAKKSATEKPTAQKAKGSVSTAAAPAHQGGNSATPTDGKAPAMTGHISTPLKQAKAQVQGSQKPVQPSPTATDRTAAEPVISNGSSPAQDASGQDAPATHDNPAQQAQHQKSGQSAADSGRVKTSSSFTLSPRDVGEAKNRISTAPQVAVNAPLHAVFVCTGNVARSAAAEVIAQGLAKDLDLTKWVFKSAGTAALAGSRAYKYVGKELEDRGYDVSQFRAQQLTADMVEKAALLLVAEKDHADWILQEWPQHHAKVHLLKQVARIREKASRRAEPLSFIYGNEEAPLDSDNIVDPYRKGRTACRTAVDEVEKSLQAVLPWLERARI